MKKLFVVLLVASLAANAWLLSKKSPVKTPAAGKIPALPVAARSARGGEPAADDIAAKLRVAVATSALPALGEVLRAAGLDESTVRAVAEGILRQRFREEASQWRIERARKSWWRGNFAGSGPGSPSQRKLVTDPLQALLGPDPLDRADAEMRYDFLPPEKRRMLAMIDLDYGDLQARSFETRSGAPTKSELDEQQMLSNERRKDVLATLSEAERVEYDLRFSETAVGATRRFAAIEATEQEFRTIASVLESSQARASAPPGDPITGAAAVERQQQTIDRLVAALGYDRALDYLWGGPGPYADTVSVLHGLSLPASNAARLFQLAADAGAQAMAIHFDGALTPEQKREALLALQQSMRPQVDALVPAVAHAKLPAHAIGWISQLGEGRYEVFVPMVSGNGRIEMPPVSVTAPPKEPRLRLLQVRPPGK